MAQPSMAMFFICSFFFVLSGSQAQKFAPALYVFGDSNVDAGNNNAISIFARSNYTPYGIDFPTGPTGRQTNGYTVADYFAKWLGLDAPPAFRLIDASQYSTISQGVNYASAGAGILPETGADVPISKGILSLDKQVDLFKKTVEEYLPPNFENEANLSTHLSKSIFLVAMGGNDYMINYLKTNNSTDPLDYTSAADHILEQLGNQLERLYNLGARKFVVLNIEALGCLPNVVYKAKPLSSKCVDYMNDIARSYNEKLQVKLEQLRSALAGSTFVLGKFFDFTLSVVTHPQNFGFKEAQNPCCTVTSFGNCEANKDPCSDRESYVFYDSFHLTEAVHKILAAICFNGKGSCVPMNVKQLASL